MRSEDWLRFLLSHSCAEEMAHEWGTAVCTKLQDSACLRERSGWRWELSFI